MPMIATTIISSIRVKPFWIERFMQMLLWGTRGGKTPCSLQGPCHAESTGKREVHPPD
jgi:hypothetical protein